ncbi:MAG TPA: tape measure protein, partial [Massilibacterium sp.]|nr:tape measure protein [Massilibacterium sp.]
MADGKVVIDVILSDGTVAKGIADINDKVGGIGNSAKKASISVGSLVKSIGLVALASKGIDMVKNSLDGAISRYDTLNNFPRVLQLMGFDAEESEAAINKLSDGISGLPTTLDSVASTAQRIAMMTGDLDGAVDTTLALNNAFLASGASSADAERGLEQYVQMLSKGEVDLQSWRTLQETMPVALNKTAEAFGFTGKSAQNDLYDALKAGEITFDDFNAKVIELNDGVGGFAEMAKESSSGIKTAFTNMNTAVVRGVTKMVEKIDEGLSKTRFKSIENIIQEAGNKMFDVLDKIANAIPPTVDKIKEVYDNLKPWLPLFTSIVGAVGIMIGAFSLFNTAKNIVNGVKLAIMGMNTALLLNPWTWVALAAIAAVLLIIQYWEPIKGFFVELWESIKEISMNVWESLKEYWNVTVEFFKELWNQTKEFFSMLWEGIKEVAISIWDSVIEKWNSIIETINVLFGPLIEFFSNLWTMIKETAIQIWESLSEFLSTLWENIKVIASAGWEIIKNAILGPILLLIDLATGDFEGFKEHLLQIWENIKDNAVRIWGALKENVLAIINLFKDTATLLWNNLKQTITNLTSALKNNAILIWNQLKSTVVNIINNLKSESVSKWSELKVSVINVVTNLKSETVRKWNELKSETKRKFEEIKSAITNTLKSVNLTSIGKNIIQGLVNGINSMKQKVMNTAQSIADGIKNKIEGALRIKSPSRWARYQVGQNVMKGTQLGLEDEKKRTFRIAE